METLTLLLEFGWARTILKSELSINFIKNLIPVLVDLFNGII